MTHNYLISSSIENNISLYKSHTDKHMINNRHKKSDSLSVNWSIPFLSRNVYQKKSLINNILANNHTHIPIVTIKPYTTRHKKSNFY